MLSDRVRLRQPSLCERLCPSHTGRTVVLVATATLSALGLLVLEVALLSEPNALVAYRGVVGRPLVQTARHLPAVHPSFRVHFHSYYHPAYLRELNITGRSDLSEEKRQLRSAMKSVSARCDDGVTDLMVDWTEGAAPYHCAETPRVTVPAAAPQIQCQRHLPDHLPLKQFCMNRTLMYDAGVPTYGHHRPLPPVYGTYRYLPPQRWLHSIDRGAVVLLYHPCAEPARVQRLTQLLRRCVYRHIVTPSLRVSRQLPLVLVTHGCRFSMSRVFAELVVAFIRAHALHGKAGQMSEGRQFNSELLETAQAPEGSDIRDSAMCPFYPSRTAADALFHQDHAGSI